MLIFFINYLLLLQAVLVLQKSVSKENNEDHTVGLSRECKLPEMSAGSRWREMVLLVVSWICIVLTAAEFIIKRVSNQHTLLDVVNTTFLYLYLLPTT